MISDNKPLRNRLIALVIVVIAFFVCLAIYNTLSNNYSETSPPVSYSPKLTNPEVLQNWLPPSSFRYTISQIDNYLQSNGIRSSLMTIIGNVSVNGVNGSGYAFNLVVQPQNQTYNVLVTIDNYSGTISTAVSVDGHQQNYFVPSQNSNGTTFSGFNGLVNDGLTSLQAEELQTAFQKFSPEANSVNINVNSIVLPTINPNSSSIISTYTFVVNIDGTNYLAKLQSIGLTEIDLSLTVPNSSKQIFNSGTISQI